MDERASEATRPRRDQGQLAALSLELFPHCPEGVLPSRGPAELEPQLASVPTPSTPVTTNQRLPAGTLDQVADPEVPSPQTLPDSE